MMKPTLDWPQRIGDVHHLEALLSQPTQAAIDTVARRAGDWLVLGAAGKMGPTLARMLQRAIAAGGRRDRVIAVSRFSSPQAEAALAAHGIDTRRGNLLDEAFLKSLPDAPNIIFMAGMKFGSTNQEALTWAMNTYLPALVARRFARSSIAAFSTGNVYGLVDVESGGSVETDRPNPVGEYAMSCLGRERMFEHFAQTLGTPVVLLRLNYAVEMRYGVLHDIGRKVWAGDAVDLAMGHVNVIWQGDANAMAIAAIDHAASPARALNIAGPERLSVRAVVERFGERFGRPVRFTGEASPTALLSNGCAAHALLGPPAVGAERVIDWTADWIARGGESLNKPTKFESREGTF